MAIHGARNDRKFAARTPRMQQVVEARESEKQSPDESYGGLPAQQPEKTVLLRKWQKGLLADLIIHIVDKHHELAKRELVRLDRLLVKACLEHADDHPELLRVYTLFGWLKRDLTDHMRREEEALFPYIIRLQEAVKRRHALPKPPFYPVRNSVSLMMAEHDTAGELLRGINAASSKFAACRSLRHLYRALEAFSQDLDDHLSLENYVLFPRAVDLERPHNSSGG